MGFDHPGFRPLWVRLTVVAVCWAWGAFEFASGAPFWAIIFIGVGCVAAWQFAIIDYSAGDDT